MEFEFDPDKNKLNIKDHHIDLVDVDGVFYDQNAIFIEDKDHDEQRFVRIGMDGSGRILVVCYTFRKRNVIRLISARKADKSERLEYERNLI